MFDATDLPVLGVGLEYWVAMDVPRTSALAVPVMFDYVEIQPPHVIFDPGLLGALGSTRPLLHSSDLSLASVGMEMDSEYLALTYRLLRATASPWLSEHISWNRFPGGDTRHFILPFLGDEVRDAVIANARILHAQSGLPVLLENAPRTLIVDLPGDAPEPLFMREVLEGADAGLVLDIDNAHATARAKDQGLLDYLRGLPLERTVEIHVHDPVADWQLLWPIAQLPSVRAVTLGWSARDAKGQDLARAVQTLKACLHNKAGQRLRALGQVDKLTQGAAAQELAAPQPLYCLAPGVALSVRDGRLKVSGGAAALQLELDLPSLSLVSHFTTAHTLASALLLPGWQTQQAMLQAAALLRELIEQGALVEAFTDAPPSAGRADAGWPDWDAALDFYLATRTRENTPFNSVEAMEQVLADKATQQPQPSAFKDYAAHPFFTLPNPLLWQPDAASPTGFLDVLTRRRSLRGFTSEPLKAEELSALLFYVWGATCVRRNALGDVFVQKTAPGGGSLHGAEVYALLMNVQGYDAGIYHYSVRRHGLELLSRDDPKDWIAQACGGQEWIADAAAVFLTTYKVQRLAWKYTSSRGFRAALLDTGHLGQSFALVGTWLQLAPFTTAALRDEIFEDKLGLDYLVEPVFMLNGVGRPAAAVVLPDRPRARSMDDSMP